MFPVRYELQFYIVLRRNSVFKGLTVYSIQDDLLFHIMFAFAKVSFL
jgi:hypothetical protein